MSTRQRNRNRPAEPAAAPQEVPRRRARIAPEASSKPAKAARTLVVGLGSIVSVLVLLGLLGVWGAGMTFILLFGDRMSEKLLVQNSEMQDTYEQRLQAYRAEIARLSLEIEQSRFDQTSVEGRVVEMGRRQRQIDARLVALKRLADLVGSAPTTGAPTLTPAQGTVQPHRISFDAPQETPQTVSPESRPWAETPSAPIWRDAGSWQADAAPQIVQVQLGAPPVVEQAPTPASGEIDLFLARMDRVLLSAEQSQMQILSALGRSFDGRIERTRSAMSMIGLSAEAVIQWRGRNEAILPNIVLPLSEQQTPFGQQVARVRQNFAILYGFKPIIETLPVTRPTSTDVRYSSGFGYRIHPLLGTRRLHGGIDMAAPIGTPVRAAGSGTVQSAGWGGGYGNLVQIDHGNGLVTRYAHLSQIGVSQRQTVGRGEVIGLMGSTGASTGSHLHFETRIHGTPVNPACFILAGDRILGAQSIPYNCEQPPVWNIRRADEEEDDDS
jgi:murein DD-endopeptidase MepM/ murein hydrolase activator NlpD